MDWIDWLLYEPPLLTGRALIKRMAEEFIEDRLDVEVTPKNIRRFAAYIIVFEREVENERNKKKKTPSERN